MHLNPLSTLRPAVDEKGHPLQVLQLFSEQVAVLPILVGTGSPEGVIESKQGRLYMNSAGGIGSILYIKRNDDVAGNRKSGWILV